MGQAMPGFAGGTASRSPYHATPAITRESALWMDPDTNKRAIDYGWSEDDVAYITNRRLLAFDLGGNLSVGYNYNDNAFLGGSDAKQAVHSLFASTTASIAYGPNNSGLSSFLSYNPMLLWFLDSVTTPEGETVDHALNHAINWNIAWSGARLRTSLDLSYTSMDGANIEGGQWVAQDMATASLTLGYDISPKTILGARASTQLIDFSGAFLGQNQYNGSLFATYQISPKVRLGPSIGYNYAEVNGGSNTEAIQYQLTADWAATAKLTANLLAGVEERSFSAGGDSIWAPIFSVGVNYNPDADGRTSIGLNAYRRMNPSVVLANQSFYATGVTANFSRQLGSRMAFTTGIGYEMTDYEPMDQEVVADRSDDLLFFTSQLTYALSQRFSVSTFYRYTDNDSIGRGAASFTRNQFGIMLTGAF
jgi:hypothetical protein